MLVPEITASPSGTEQGAQTTDYVRWAESLPAWTGQDPGVRLNLLKEALIADAGMGVMHVALTTDPPVEQITDDDGNLLPLPAGYLRVGSCTHVPDAKNRFTAEVDVSVAAYPDLVYPIGRVLVLTTVDDAAGPVHVASFLPRVRANWQSADETEVLAHPDADLGYTWKAMFGGPGWKQFMVAAGCDPA